MSSQDDDLKLNEEFSQAFDLLENTADNLLIIGRAGTGKSTFIQYFRDHSRKSLAVLAPTGIAAIHVQGQTIHSFFRFKPDITPDKVPHIKLRSSQKTIYQKIDTLIIDEISMVRSDLLDCIDIFLRIHGRDAQQPFGGIQMVFVGDLYQLPPVVTAVEKNIFQDVYPSPYFFDARVFQDFPIQLRELKEIYRQKDPGFIEILNAIRVNTITPVQLERLNERYLPDFVPGEQEFYISLTTTNDLADTINQSKLDQLKTESYYFQGEIEGNFDEKYLPAPVRLEVKSGAQVMLLNNDPADRWRNGTMGKIAAVDHDTHSEDVLIVELSPGESVEVRPFTWEMFRFAYNKETKKVESEKIGSFKQLPIRLAWAVTIHKSQGKTFAKIVIDLGRGTFSFGQLYVALSRCTTLNGIILKKPVEKKHIWMDPRVSQFLSRLQIGQFQEDSGSEVEKRALLEMAIVDRRPVEIIFRKTNEEITHCCLFPCSIGETENLGQRIWSVEGKDPQTRGLRVFRLDRIVQVRGIDSQDEIFIALKEQE